MKNNLLKNLNDQQKEVVTTINGPLLVVAGPGSGKTRTITHRIAYLIENNKCSSENIIAMTFTNKAAQEMKSRLSLLIDSSNQSKINASTFHSFCARTLRTYGNHINISSDFSIYDDVDQLDLIKQILKELEIDPKKFPPKIFRSNISAAKSKLLTYDYIASNTENYFDELLARIYEKYTLKLTQLNSLDFDDLLLKTYSLLNETKILANQLREKYLYLMVDEFQDTNLVQYKIAKLLSLATNNLCVVGDPDQSIYSWRNADIKNLIKFQEDFPDSKTISLSENYRSSSNILSAAKKLIEVNTLRIKNELWTKNNKGDPIIIKEAFNQDDEASFVINEIKKFLANKIPLNQIAIMYRVNAQSRAIENACLKFGIPYQIIGSLKFYRRQEIKDLTSYLRVINNPNDDISLLRIVNTPSKGIGNKTIDLLKRISQNLNTSIYSAIEILTSKQQEIKFDFKNISETQNKSLKNVLNIFSKIRSQINNLNLSEIIDLTLELFSYEEYIKNTQDNHEERLENLKEFRISAQEFIDTDTKESLNNFLENISLVSDIDSMEENSSKATLITLHQSKGLEYKVVFIIGMEEGLLPHSRSFDNIEQIEEERRLFYVGITRAKTNLFLTRSFKHGLWGEPRESLPSRFLRELPRDSFDLNRDSFDLKPTQKKTELKTQSKVNKIDYKNKFKTGDKVKHSTFGKGLIVAMKPVKTDFEVTIVFKNPIGIKHLLVSIANLEKDTKL